MINEQIVTSKGKTIFDTANQSENHLVHQIIVKTINKIIDKLVANTSYIENKNYPKNLKVICTTAKSLLL